MDMAAQRHGFQVAMIATGNTVNQDASLGHVHVTEGAKGVSVAFAFNSSGTLTF